MDINDKYIGYLKYSGKSVENGLLDMKKSANALLGFDEILRYFLIKEDPNLIGLDFEIPVRIKKGSWEIVIPEIIDKIFSPVGIGYTFAATYFTATATKAAQEGLFSTGAAKDVKVVFKAAIRSAQWVIRIGSRIGMLKKRLDDVKLGSNPGEVLIPDDQGKMLITPKKYFDLYMGCPIRIFSKNAKIIDNDRVLELGVFDAGKEEKVTLSIKEKYYYYSESEESGVVLPELIEGELVELEGYITKGNEKANTLGFEYKGHILSCVPEVGTITEYKSGIISRKDNRIFPKVKIKGRVDRTSVKGEFKEIKPRIIFSKIVLLEEIDSNLKLF